MTVKPTASPAILGLMTAILFLGQVLLRALPNVEIVSLLLLLYTLFLGRKVFYIVYAFVLLEGFLYGFGIWWFSYLYVWSIWVTVVYLLRQNTSALFWSILSGLFGILFGGLCALPYLLIGGAGAAFSYWVSGLFFDLVHCAGNFALCLALFHPLRRLMQTIFGTH